MTRYTVVWLQSEEDRLAEIWLNSENRSEVSAASHAIDVELSADPSHKGMPIVENVRLLVAPPLAVIFEVLEGDLLVRVLRVKYQGIP